MNRLFAVLSRRQNYVRPMRKNKWNVSSYLVSAFIVMIFPATELLYLNIEILGLIKGDILICKWCFVIKISFPL
jgi:hypothetical protein